MHYDILDFSSNRSVSDLELAACRALAKSIEKEFIRSSDAERAWVTPHGQKVFGEITSSLFGKINAEVLDRLRVESRIFSGWDVTNVLLDEPVPSWTDALAANFVNEGELWQDWAIPAFATYTKGLPENFICNPPLVCGEMGYRVGEYCVNRDVVCYQERINALVKGGLLQKLLSKPKPVILEIGGGYGALAYFIKKIVPSARYYIVDLPSSLLFSGCYLTIALPNEQTTVYSAMPPSNSGAITLIAAPLQTEIDIGEIDLAINTLSFQEMPLNTVGEYARFVAARLAPGGILFEQNFDNSHFGRDTFCNPQDAIRPYFKHRETIDGRFFWGQPTMWSR